MSKPIKICTGCERPLALSEFAKKGSGRQPRCRLCRSDERAVRRAIQRTESAPAPRWPTFDHSLYPRWMAP